MGENIWMWEIVAAGGGIWLDHGGKTAYYYARLLAQPDARRPEDLKDQGSNLDCHCVLRRSADGY